MKNIETAPNKLILTKPKKVIAAVAASITLLSGCGVESLAIEEVPTAQETLPQSELSPVEKFAKNFKDLALLSRQTQTMQYSNLPCPGSTFYRVETARRYRHEEALFEDGIFFRTEAGSRDGQEGWVGSGSIMEESGELFDALCVNVHDRTGIMTFIIDGQLATSGYEIIDCLDPEIDFSEQTFMNSATQNSC